MTEQLHFHFSFHALGKEMATHSSVLAWKISDGGAWWAAVCGVTQSWTRLKRLGSSRSRSLEENRNSKKHSGTVPTSYKDRVPGQLIMLCNVEELLLVAF